MTVVGTGEPRLMPTISFGKHRGSAWSDVPADYLEWVIGQVDLDVDLVWHAKKEF